MNEQELQLQRLVDGQLDLKQTQKMLQRADLEPELWREMAAAFVENQIWQSAVIADSSTETTNQDEPILLRSDGSSGSNLSTPGIKFWLALAAAVVAGIWLGRASFPNGTTIDDGSRSIASHQNTPESDSLSNPTSDRPEQRLVSYEPAHHLSMGEAGEVPLYTLEQAQELGLLKEQSLPQETVNQLRKRGYQLEQNTQYISGKAQDGRRILVPVRSVRFIPGN